MKSLIMKILNFKQKCRIFFLERTNNDSMERIGIFIWQENATTDRWLTDWLIDY